MAEVIFTGESSELEFKRELPKNKDTILKTISAFSNSGVAAPVLSENEIDCVMTFGKENVVRNDDVVINVVRNDSDVVTNVVRNDNDVATNLSDVEKSVFDILKKDATYTAKEISDMLKMSSRQIQRIFATLKERGVIRHIGSTKGGHWEIIKADKTAEDK